MCGIFGVVSVQGRTPSLDDGAAERLRDLLTHRGPDDAGLWREGNALLTHRRLAVIDLDRRARQPMVSEDGRFVITYNGELYNDAELRSELRSRGRPESGFRTGCDTETVLEAFACWGTEAIGRMRGMFAFAIWDRRENLLTLARDPLGVKPLYFHCDGHEIIFASEPAPIVRCPTVGPRPNMRMVSAYLTTIRTVLDGETLFEGVYSLGPGQVAHCSLAGRSPVMRILDHWTDPPVAGEPIDGSAAAERLRAALDDSVAAHLRADVPTCSLLSGGIDSACVTALAAKRTTNLRTYCAGGAPEQPGGDLEMARLAAEHFGLPHEQALLTEEQSASAWPSLVNLLGVPLSTPNEVAIHAVARRLRDDGCIVTLSGEGADELLAGYESPMRSALDFVRADPRAGPRDAALFQLTSNAWVPSSIKHAIFEERIWSDIERDAWLEDAYERTFDRVGAEAGENASPLDAHLRFHRRINLTGLLQRLDAATMLASVEGRTPFSDGPVAALTTAMPMSVKFDVDDAFDAPADGATATAAPPRVRTKIALRRAFARDLPEQIVSRPKASFPLPFEAWLPTAVSILRESDLARAIFTTAAIETISESPATHWRLAWPMINIAIWGRRWWG